MCVRMPEGVTKEDVQFRLTTDSIRLGVQAFPPLLDGQLFAAIDPEASAWIIKNDKRFAGWKVSELFFDLSIFRCTNSSDTGYITPVFYLEKKLMNEVNREPQTINTKEQLQSPVLFILLCVNFSPQPHIHP